jgi:hypothetical protein
MKVEIKDNVFDDPQSDHQMLTEVIGHGIEGRYRIVYSGEPESKARAWRDRQPQEMQLIWDLVYDSAKLEALTPSSVTVIIDAVRESNWSGVPVLTLRCARDFLRKPFKVLVENVSSDRSFLCALANTENRNELDRAIAASWLEFQHSGGISDLPNRLTEWDQENGRAIKGFVFFDSHALVPNEPSAQAEFARQSCLRRRVPHYVLSRRMIENYLPTEALSMWIHCGSPGPDSGERRRRHVAFCRMNADQRNHYNFKHGFHGDLARVSKEGCRPKVDALFGSVEDNDKIKLSSGFHYDIAKLFMHQGLDNTWFVTDGGSAEINQVIQRILDHL